MALRQGMDNDSRASWNKRVFIVTSSLMVAAMMACIMIAVVQFIRRIDSGWQVTYLPWLGFFLSLEAIYTTHLSRKLSYSSDDWLKMRLAELVVILVVVKILLYIIYSPFPLWFNLQSWMNYFMDFFNPAYWVAMGFTVFLWFFASQFGVDLYEMGRDDYAKRQEVAYYFSEDRIIARRRMVDRILMLGAIMVGLTAVMSMESKFIWGNRTLITGTYTYLLLYFVIGFALLSQTQFAILGASWRQESTPVQRNVASRWVVTSLVFLLLLAGLVWFLPTRYSLDLLGALSLLFSSLMSIVMFLWNLFGFLFASLFSVLGFFTDDSEPTSENLQLPSLPMTPIVPGQPLPWIEVVKSILFWSVLIGVIGFALHQYLQQNQGLWQAIKRFPLVSWLVNLFEGLRGWFSQSWRSMASGMGAVRDRLIPRRSARIAPETWHYIRLNSLSPRQQVLFFFQALVHKAEQRGIRRGKAQTPYEYAQVIKVEIPEVETNIEPFTDTFIEARYSQHPVTYKQASQAHQWWNSLRKVILHKKPIR
jgi:hypothetical protein